MENNDEVMLGYIPARVAKSLMGFEPEGRKGRMSIVIRAPEIDALASAHPESYLSILNDYVSSLFQSNQQYATKGIDNKCWIVGETRVDGEFRKFCFLVELRDQRLCVIRVEDYSKPLDEGIMATYGEWKSFRKLLTQNASYYRNKIEL
jgi:hypothetical protein